MTNINQLSSVSVLSPGDLAVVFSTSNGDSRKASMTVLQAYMQDNLDLSQANPTVFDSIYLAPSTTPYSVTPVVTENNAHLIMIPVAAIASVTITLPAARDKQELLVTTTQELTALTLVGSVIGAPTTLLAGGFFKLKFDVVTATWYRVG